MYTQEITVQNEVGLHARPATYFIQKANEFKSGIWVEKEERRVNAKSLLGVLSLGIVKGTTITLIADGVDAVFTPTDNKIMEAELAIAPELAEAGIPHYTGADSFVRNGAFATCGVNYTELGTYTADMALDILETGVVPAYHIMDGGIITVNTETAQTLGADYSMFSDMGQVVEVATTED